MRMVKIEAGAKAEVLLKKDKWAGTNFKPYKPPSDIYVELSDVVFSPDSAGRVRLSVDQDRLAKLGYWAIKRDAFILLVPGEFVSIVG